jgi:hypothetical protein
MLPKACSILLLVNTAQISSPQRLFQTQQKHKLNRDNTNVIAPDGGQWRWRLLTAIAGASWTEDDDWSFGK